MGIFDILSKGIKAMVDEAKKPASFKLGEVVEEYVREIIFPKEWYDLLYKTPDYSTSKNDYAEMTKNPDFTFRDKYSKKEFQVEVKYRSTLLDGKIVWANQNQLKRYLEADKKSPVFILIATGNGQDPLTKMYLIPVKQIKYTGLFPNSISKYEIDYENAISSKKLWERCSYS